MTQVRAASTATAKKPRKAAEVKSMENAATFTAEQRTQMIRELAYFKAQERGFTAGNPEQDWFEAEAEIDRRYGKSNQ
jgi:hypothetical protein